jgi:hypothetical protein
MIIYDFCNTLVPFNTTQLFLDKAYSLALGLRLFKLIKSIFAKFQIFIPESIQIKFIRTYFPGAYIKSVKWINKEIDDNFQENIFKKGYSMRQPGEKLIINSATFYSLIYGAKCMQKFDIVIASDDSIINSGVQKVKSLLPHFDSCERVVFFSDSIEEDYALFLIAEKKFLVRNTQLYEF